MNLPMIRTPTKREAETFTTALGFLELALAAFELARPGALSRSLGLRENRVFLKGFGARGMATGAGMFGWRRGRGKSLWIWARVAGDAKDLAVLAPALSRDNPKRKAAAVAFAVVVGVTIIDALCARALDER
jgi:hypothetical protein